MDFFSLSDAVDARKSLALQALVPPVVEDNRPVGSGQIQTMGTAADGYELEPCQLVESMKKYKVSAVNGVGTNHDFDFRNLLKGPDTHFLIVWLHLSAEVDVLEPILEEHSAQN